MSLNSLYAFILMTTSEFYYSQDVDKFSENVCEYIGSFFVHITVVEYYCTWEVLVMSISVTGFHVYLLVFICACQCLLSVPWCFTSAFVVCWCVLVMPVIQPRETISSFVSWSTPSLLPTDVLHTDRVQLINLSSVSESSSIAQSEPVSHLLAQPR